MHQQISSCSHAVIFRFAQVEGRAGYTSPERQTEVLYFFMTKFSTARLSRDFVFVLFVCGLLAASSYAQAPQKAAPSDASSSAQHGISLAAKGRCQEALPLLKKSATHLTD